MAERARLDVDENLQHTTQTPESACDHPDIQKEPVNPRLQEVMDQISATGNECWIENGVVHVEISMGGGEISNLLVELFELVQESSYGANFYC